MTNVLFAAQSLDVFAITDQNVLPHHLVYQHLELIEASPAFRNRPGQFRLLSYLVRETYAGRAEAICSTHIARDVLGRHGNFDNRRDSVVRVAVYRLRKNLASYYGSISDPAALQLVFELEKGSLIPKFRRVENKTPVIDLLARPFQALVRYFGDAP